MEKEKGYQEPEWMGILKKTINEQTGSKERKGLYSVLYKRLRELKDSSRKEIISFSDVFGKLCRNFSISKKECWEILFIVREAGFIEIVPYHGIKVN